MAHPKRVYLLSELEFTVGIKRCKVLIYYLIVKNKSYIDEKAFGLVLYLVELYHVKGFKPDYFILCKPFVHLVFSSLLLLLALHTIGK